MARTLQRSRATVNQYIGTRWLKIDRVRRRLALLLVAGCNQVLGIGGTHLMPDAGIQLCDPLPFDPGRYFRIDNQGLGFTWTNARAVCATLGFDLAVIDQNDTVEITNELTGGTLPFWLGVDYNGAEWGAIDTCTPVLAWGNGQPTTESIGQCLLQDFGGMVSLDCTAMQAGPGISALCETPRPSVACRMAAMQRDYVVASTTPLDHDAAEQLCGGMGRHLVEIDSSDELSFVLQNHSDVPDFWVGARRAGNAFNSPTSCPQVFQWSSNEPTGAPQDCVYYNGGMHSDFCDTAYVHAVICEAN
jgi:hypothetical protein